MEASDLKRVKELEAENARLKQMFADIAPENTAMKDVIAKKLLRRPASVKWQRTWPPTTGFLCRDPASVRNSRSAYYREPEHGTVRDAMIIAVLAELVENRPNRVF